MAGDETGQRSRLTKLEQELGWTRAKALVDSRGSQGPSAGILSETNRHRDRLPGPAHLLGWRTRAVYVAELPSLLRTISPNLAGYTACQLS